MAGRHRFTSGLPCVRIRALGGRRPLIGDKLEVDLAGRGGAAR
ncbi:hypothetical protein GA0074695_5437 [Micromonospora viridifaciens]|uniref:Uncharacterized protein n=1 Tax=Micromonospora viridifaciens TaxID=1881 RepID=A0A1C4ZDK3_MICVI|nr:hypothetical protein GA0074695_5437 [Micromonospora viridifaciens]